MNCCDANGKCKGGKGCPVGEPLPIQMHGDPADEGAPIWLDLITVIVLVEPVSAASPEGLAYLEEAGYPELAECQNEQI